MLLSRHLANVTATTTTTTTRSLSTSSICCHYGGTWNNNRRLQNPNAVKEMPTLEFKKDGSFKKTRMIYVCGFGSTGALGLQKFYKPEKKTIEQVRRGDSTTNSFRRLPLDSSSTISDISCGYGFTLLAARVEGTTQTVLGFGLNNCSQIGYQVSRPGFPLEIVNNPSPIFVPTKEPIKRVSCGRSHSLFLNSTGQVFSAGNNSFGQCGRPIDDKEEYFGKKNVHKIEDLPENIVDIHCGQDHSMFISDKGELYACGWSADGQTGVGHYNNEPRPTRVKGALEGVRIKKVSCSADTVLALDHEGNVFGWGNSEYAQFSALTKDESMQFSLPKHLNLLQVPGKIVDIAASGTMCAVLNDKGQVYVWGYGLLGKGPEVEHLMYPSLLPETLFDMNPYNPDTRVEQIYAGLSQFAAVTNKGDLYTWGRNRGAALGLPHGGPQYFPMLVNMNLAAVKKVSLGVDHTCAIVEKVC